MKLGVGSHGIPTIGSHVACFRRLNVCLGRISGWASQRGSVSAITPRSDELCRGAAASQGLWTMPGAGLGAASSFFFVVVGRVKELRS